MPVENERKYVLKTTDIRDVYVSLRGWSYTEMTISQGYLDDRTRLRKIEFDETVLFFFTFKLKVGDDLIEIETEILESDFDALWSVAQRRIKKTRIVVPFVEKWEIDVFYDSDDSVYLIMAEIEFADAKQIEPTEIPPFIADNLLYEVPREGDDRFFNSKLGDPEAVRALLLTL